MIYRDSQGRTITENTNTSSQEVARLAVALKALETARAKVLALEMIVHAYQSDLEAGATGTPQRNAHRRSAAADERSRTKNPAGGTR